jgi:hypothetical protein
MIAGLRLSFLDDFEDVFTFDHINKLNFQLAFGAGIVNDCGVNFSSESLFIAVLFFIFVDFVLLSKS